MTMARRTDLHQDDIILWGFDPITAVLTDMAPEKEMPLTFGNEGVWISMSIRQANPKIVLQT